MCELKRMMLCIMRYSDVVTEKRMEIWILIKDTISGQSIDVIQSSHVYLSRRQGPLRLVEKVVEFWLRPEALFSGYLVCRRLGRMEKCGDDSGNGKAGQRRANREQLRAVQTAWLYMDSIPQTVHIGSSKGF